MPAPELILALDYPSGSDALALVDRLGDADRKSTRLNSSH